MLRVDKLENDCWLWNLSTINSGYGKVMTKIAGKRRTLLAHRVSLHLFRGFDLDSKLYVCHKCDVPRCVNPDHLFIGLQQDNMNDMKKKCRQKSISLKGEKNPSSKLTEEKVLEIVSLLQDFNNKEIAKMYGLNHGTISNIRLGKSWSHLTKIQKSQVKKYGSIRTKYV